MIKLLLLLVLLFNIISKYQISSFVKNLLSSPPIIDRQDLWSRSPLNTASYANYTLMLTRTLEVPTPSYVQILKQGALSITSFSLLRRGSVMQFDLNGVRHPKTWDGDYLWPNELSEYRDKTGVKVMLVADGFLMPGQNDGGIYAIRDPDSPQAKSQRITKHKKGWFYHRAMHVVLPGGKEGILTARARKSIIGSGSGELVWLNIPAEYQSQSSSAGGYTNMETYSSGEWEETVIATGPDVMFELLDMDHTDDRIEIISAHFFGKKLSVHSIRATDGGYPHVEVVDQSEMDTVGRPYGLCLAAFSNDNNKNRCSDSGSSSRNYNYNSNNNYEAATGGSSGGDVGSSNRHTFEYSEDSWTNFSRERKYKSVNKINKAKYRRRISACRNKKRQFERLDNQALCDSVIPTHLLVTTHECSYDLPSAINMARGAISGNYPIVKTSPQWMNSKEASPAVSAGAPAFAAAYTNDMGLNSLSGDNQNDIVGGSLFSYAIPSLQSKKHFPPQGMAKRSFDDHVGISGRIPGEPEERNEVSLSTEEVLSNVNTFASAARHPVSEEYLESSAGKSESHGSIPLVSTSFAATVDAEKTAVPSRLSSNVPKKIINHFSNQLPKYVPQLNATVLPGDRSILQQTSHSSSLESMIKIEDWPRSTLCSGFKVRGWGGIFAPGAPGFPYVFHMPNKPQAPPLILLAGDCTGSAYIFAPSSKQSSSSNILTKESAVSLIEQGIKINSDDMSFETGSVTDDSIPDYELVFEIECGATVGSAAVSSTNDGTGDVNLYIPAYELNKVHVFRLSDADFYKN